MNCLAKKQLCICAVYHNVHHTSYKVSCLCDYFKDIPSIKHYHLETSQNNYMSLLAVYLEKHAVSCLKDSCYTFNLTGNCSCRAIWLFLAALYVKIKQ